MHDDPPIGPGSQLINAPEPSAQQRRDAAVNRRYVAADGTLPTIEQQQREYADLGLTTTTHPAERDLLGSWAVETAPAQNAAPPADDIPLAPEPSVHDDGASMLRNQRGVVD